MRIKALAHTASVCVNLWLESSSWTGLLTRMTVGGRDISDDLYRLIYHVL